MNRLQAASIFTNKGYIINRETEFYKTFDNLEMIGMKVGQYSHSCHVDSSDFVVLLFDDGSVESFFDWRLTRI